MSALENYHRQVCELLKTTKNVLMEAEAAEVEHLIKHDEHAEAIRTLAWIVVEEDKRISADIVKNIRVLSERLVDPHHMPTNLESQIDK